MTWSERAACLGTLTEMWFPGKGNAAKNAYKAAKWYCDRCPVRRQCLEEALRTELTSCRFGMRAGLTPDERDAISRGDDPFPDFPPPLPLAKPPTSNHPEGALAMSITDITPSPRQDPAEPPATAEALIAWGAAHPSTRLQALANRARAALTDLSNESQREAKVTAAEARITRLKAQLANAEQDLRSAKGTGKPKDHAQTSSSEDYAAIRAWARESGIEVGAVGRPKREVIDAYHTAHSEPLAAAG